MNNLEQEQNIEKFRELYEYSREMHFKQLERANRVDQKAAMFLSALTVLLGFAGFLLKAVIEDTIPPQNTLDYVFLIATLLSGITVVGSWIAFLLVLRVRNLENLRLDDETLDFFQANRRVDIHYAISKRASEAFADNDSHIAAKLRRLTSGYLLAKISVLLLAISLAIFGYMKWVD
jgi:hypothetical protein